MKRTFYYVTLFALLSFFITPFAQAQVSVSSPTSGSTVSQCGSYIIHYYPGGGFSPYASADVYLNDSSGPIVQHLGYPSGYLDMNYDNPISAASLTPGSSYQVKVYDAYNTSNYAWSGIFTVTSLTPPVSIAQTMSSYDWIEINWPVVSGASSYGVDVATTSDFSSGIVWSNYTASGADPYGLYITGLTEGATYYVRINSSGSCGTTGYSSTYSFSTSTCTAPSPPTANAATTIKSTSFVVNWSSVAGATNGYDIIVTRSGSSVTYSSASGTTSKLIDMQHPSSSYTYKVRSKSACATSGDSNTINVSTTALGVPVISSPSGAGGPDNSFEWTVSCALVDGATQYHFQVSTENTFPNTVYDVMSGDETEQFELDYCETYWVRIRSKCFTGEYSAWSTPHSLPGVACRQAGPEIIPAEEPIMSSVDVDQELAFFPNPAETVLRVAIPRKIDTNKVGFLVMDMTGKNVTLPTRIAPGYAEIDVTSIPSGIYFVSLTDGKSKHQTKFIRK